MSLNTLANMAINQSRKSSISETDWVAKLTNYIPGEMIAAFIAILPITTINQLLSATQIYIIFVIVTPLIFLAIFYRKLKVNNETCDIKKLPIYKIVASMVAFSAWGLAIYGEQILGEHYSGLEIYLGLLAAFIAWLLDFASPWFEKK